MELTAIDGKLLGEMIRHYRKSGFDIPEGQPRTSQDGEAIAARLSALDKVAKAAVTFCESSADYPALVQSIGDMRSALKEAGYGE